MLTTVDENDVLEVYINVPVQQAPQLKLGLPVRLVDDRGQVLATNKITFVSPNVDTSTQSVLAKAQLVEGRGQFRSDQFVRARVVWTHGARPDGAGDRGGPHQRAVLRVRRGEERRRAWLAKQKPVQLGEIIGNDYVVQSGLAPGEQLIVSGLQKIRDGAPVMPAPPAGAAPQAPKAP